VAILIALVLALGIGYLNGMLVTKTGLPSFIITLGTFLGLQGINLGVTKAITGTVLVGGVADEPGFTSAHWLFASSVKIGDNLFKISIVWWILLTVVISWLLLRTKFGNWVFAAGGDSAAARNVGVPAARTKLTLFMGVSVAAWLVGTISVMRFTTVQANQGIGQELIYIVAAVIGGCLLTGGFGSVVGASLGALIFGMVSQGIVYLGWDADWFKLFLGLMLLLAVLANTYLRRYAEQSRR
jgi:simple sugar transport system permease protein